MATLNDLRYRAAKLQSEIDTRTQAIKNGCLVFNSTVNDLMFFLTLNGVQHCFSFKEIPPEFQKFVNDYTTRLIAEKTILLHELETANDQILIAIAKGEGQRIEGAKVIFKGEGHSKEGGRK